MDIISIFEELVKIPSPSLCEDAVANKIMEYTYNNGINAYLDDYQNVIIKIPANCEGKKPLLLSAHMDVVGNSSPVNICYSDDKKIIKTDIPCPRCGSEIIARQGKGGTLYYTCEAYPECDFSSWDKPLAEKCPNCSTNLYYKKARKLIVCKTKGCEYQREEQVNGDANE